MPDSGPDPNARTFDHFANCYGTALEEALSASGETSDFFARGRIAWLARRLGEMKERPRTVLDYGCGIGTTAPVLHELLGVDAVTGIDVSPLSVAHARRQFGGERTQFMTVAEHAPDGRFDLAYCNGVFHHIPVAKRPSAARHIWRSLRGGGLFALWENNIWNPGTRYVMARCKFDVDAIPLTPPETRRLVANAGFQVLRTDFCFIFPGQLRWLRGLEPALVRFPIGAQYLVLCRKPR
jgi:SAM-dependent methyltransferase